MAEEQCGVRAGWADFLGGRLAEAHAACERAIRADADDGRAWELLGLVFHDAGQYLEAADALERASLLLPVRDEARVALAACYGALRRRRLATELYLELMLRGQLDLALMLQVAAGLDAVDEPGLAMEACRRAADLDRDSAQLYYDMGFYAARAGKPARITEALTRRAIDLDPGHLPFRLGLISLLVRVGRSDEAACEARELSESQLDAIDCPCCRERVIALLEGRETDGGDADNWVAGGESRPADRGGSQSPSLGHGGRDSAPRFDAGEIQPRKRS